MANFPSCLILVLVFTFARIKGDMMTIERGANVNLICRLPNNVANVIWQMVTGNTTLNISSCRTVDNKCINQMSSSSSRIFSSTITSSGGINTTSTLSFTASVSDKQFSCLDNTGAALRTYQLEVYALPLNPQCTRQILITEIEFTCTTDNVYPGLEGYLQISLNLYSFVDIEPTYTNCTDDVYGTGTLGHYKAKCTWRFPLSQMPPESYAQATMTARVSNMDQYTKKYVTSNYIKTIFNTPRVMISDSECPVGPGVYGQSILNGTVATCKCLMYPDEIIAGYARWFTKDGTVVGNETSDRSSTLTFSYKALDPEQSYNCRPITILKMTVSDVSYTPLFIYPEQSYNCRPITILKMTVSDVSYTPLFIFSKPNTGSLPSRVFYGPMYLVFILGVVCSWRVLL